MKIQMPQGYYNLTGLPIGLGRKNTGMSGKRHSQESIKKMSLAKIGHKFCGGTSGWFKKGENHSKEKSPSWKGGNCQTSRRKYNLHLKPDKCEICGKLDTDIKRGLYCDHNHKTGKFRGWVCPRCNYALGLSHDDCSFLLNLINYINKNKEA
jgi:hypothetical protein